MINKRALLPRLAVLGTLAFNLPLHAQFSTPMRDIDNGARQPVNFSATFFVNAFAASSSVSNLVTVPAGKRLVIETISFNALILTANKETGYLTVQVTAGTGTASGATTASHVIPAVRLVPLDSASDLIGGNAALHLYADAGSQVVVTYTRGPVSGFSPTINVSITGHFVTLP